MEYQRYLPYAFILGVALLTACSFGKSAEEKMDASCRRAVRGLVREIGRTDLRNLYPNTTFACDIRDWERRNKKYTEMARRSNMAPILRMRKKDICKRGLTWEDYKRNNCDKK